MLLPERYEYHKAVALGYRDIDQMWSQFCSARHRFSPKHTDWLSVRVSPGIMVIRHTAHNELVCVPTAGMRVAATTATRFHQEVKDGVRTTAFVSPLIRSSCYRSIHLLELAKIADEDDPFFVSRVALIEHKLQRRHRKFSTDERDFIVETVLNLLQHEYRLHTPFTEDEIGSFSRVSWGGFAAWYKKFHGEDI